MKREISLAVSSKDRKHEISLSVSSKDRKYRADRIFDVRKIHGTMSTNTMDARCQMPDASRYKKKVLLSIWQQTILCGGISNQEEI